MKIPKDRIWYTANTVYEDFPIYFRRPDIRAEDLENFYLKFPLLLTVKHLLKKVKSNGLPEPDYNDSLENLDNALIAPFVEERNGIVAIVETFSGYRTYYIYINSEFDANHSINKITEAFPEENITWKIHDDPKWRLFKGYATDFGFYNS